ncbi:MAG: hypothetical protein GY715_20955 [Planctomycetes bacterium]|nr:hypothetical protein [Planctomycetota bacterium]
MMMARATGVALIAVVLLSAGCGGPKISDRDLDFVGPADAAKLVERKPTLFRGANSAVWVDPRSDIEFRAGHIPGALHVPLEQAADRVKELEAYDVIIVYGSGYNDPVALAMSKTLLSLRLDEVRTLRGGLRSWEEAGNELETGRSR